MKDYIRDFVFMDEFGYKVANVNYRINDYDVYIEFDLIDENGVKLKTEDELYYSTGLDVFMYEYGTANPTMEQVVEQLENAIKNGRCSIIESLRQETVETALKSIALGEKLVEFTLIDEDDEIITTNVKLENQETKIVVYVDGIKKGEVDKSNKINKIYYKQQISKIYALITNDKI